MSLVSPRAVLARVAGQVPAACRRNIVVIDTVIRPERMETLSGPGPKRSNKDLGRVLTIARLAGRDTVAEWPGAWAEALEISRVGLLAHVAATLDEFRAVAQRLIEGVAVLVRPAVLARAAEDRARRAPGLGNE